MSVNAPEPERDTGRVTLLDVRGIPVLFFLLRTLPTISRPVLRHWTRRTDKTAFILFRNKTPWNFEK